MLAAPRPAEACQPDPCELSNTWNHFSIASEEIAADGVVRIDAGRGNGEATVEEALAFVDLQVTDSEGDAVDGTIEYVDAMRAYLWRPAAPLTAGQTYDATLLVDNEALSLALDDKPVAQMQCSANIEAATSLDVDLPALPALLAPAIDSSFEHEVEDVLSLSSMVCCDGAFPSAQVLDCFGEAEPQWDQGHCAAGTGYGWANGSQVITGEPLHPAVQSDLALRMVQTDGNQVRYGSPGSLGLTLRNNEAFCARLEVMSLASGQVVEGPEHCYGDDLVDQLGSHPIDPTDALASCAAQPYTCEIALEAWDPKACEPWGDPAAEDESGGEDSGGNNTGGTSGGVDTSDDDDGPTGAGGSSDTASQDGELDGRGCSCTSGRSNSGPAALWLLVLGLAWRRNRAPRPAG
ncbi:MAG: hypothetical protein K0V04_24500 [Deltaproteobacteria bacterium]|nr:hypothetical protein [Deltaproteobacteria bacterium]